LYKSIPQVGGSHPIPTLGFLPLVIRCTLLFGPRGGT
jgi:hypothetical protein